MRVRKNPSAPQVNQEDTNPQEKTSKMSTTLTPRAAPRGRHLLFLFAVTMLTNSPLAPLVIPVHSKSLLQPQQAVIQTQTQTQSQAQQPQAQLLPKPRPGNSFAPLPNQYVARYHHHHQQQQQPTVMPQPASNQPQLVSGPMNNFQLGRQPITLHQQHHLGSRLPTVRPTLHHTNHHNQNSHQHHTSQQHYQVPSMCHIQEHLKPYSRCQGRDEAAFNNTAKAEFRSRLLETSSELRHLLDGHLQEFRALSLGLVSLARNDTLNKLQQQFSAAAAAAAAPSSSSSSRSGRAQVATSMATRRLFEAMHGHLLSYHQAGQEANELLTLRFGHQRSSLSQQELINQELANYFRRLHLIQLKQMLDARLAGQQMTGSSVQHHVDLDCLDKNLDTQERVELVLRELISGQTAQTSHQQSIRLEQAKLSLSIRQSLEFARALLSSLHLTSEMFANITQQVDDWMPSQACHAALTQMTVCQECHVPSSAASVKPPTQVSSSVSQLPICENYCLNVARGCMNDLYDINKFWSQHLKELEEFKWNMIQTNNIENVMSSLDAKLANFIARLQLQYSSTLETSAGRQEVAVTQDAPAAAAAASPSPSSSSSSSTSFQPDQLPLSSELIKRCPRDSQETMTQLQPDQPQQAPSGPSTFLSGLFFGRSNLAADSSATTARLAGRPATKMLPPTQQRPAERQMMEVAHQARQSNALSLFNRLSSLVHQLQTTRDFFVEWPQQVCSRLRRMSSNELGGGGGVQTGGSLHSSNKQSARLNGSSSGSTGECWNGRDFSGYNKPLAQFGSPISAGHPELAVSEPLKFSTSILDQVARLKEVNSRLKNLAEKSFVTPLDLLAAGLSLQTKTSSEQKAAVAAARVSNGGESSSLVVEPHSDSLRRDSIALESPQESSDLDVAAAEAIATTTDDPEAPDGEAAESDGDGDGDAAADSEADAETDEDETRREDEEDQQDEHDQDQAAENSDQSVAQTLPGQDIVPECRSDDCSDLLVDNSQQQQVDPPNHQEQFNSVHGGAGPPNGLDVQQQQAANNYVLNHHQASTPGGMQVLAKYPVAMVNVHQLQHQQQHSGEIYPIEAPPAYNPYEGGPQFVPASSSASGQLSGHWPALMVLVVGGHLLLCVATLLQAEQTRACMRRRVMK